MSKEPLFVTCPVCGKVNQKSIFTYSEVRCQRYRKDEDKIKELQNEIKNRNVRITMDILERKIERIIND